jgi:TonB family protein
MFSEPPTQPSLFYFIKEEPERGLWSDVDWSILRHPIRFLKEEWKAPRTRPSLFHYIAEKEEKRPFEWKEFLRDLVTVSRFPLFIPSVFSDPQNQVLERAQLRTRRIESSILSLLSHLALIALAFFLVQQHSVPARTDENVVYVNNPIFLPFTGDGREGGGGGGGGKQEPIPASSGRLPDISRTQLVAPDPTNPTPLLPVEDLLAATPTVVMPIDIPQDQLLPIGDITAPSRDLRSSGPGSGGGIGIGRGTGVGPGTGAGVGPGSGGGFGGGSGGGIGDGTGSGTGPYVIGPGITEPVLLVQPLPPYTEEARKARVQGIVLIQAIVRRDGTADSFRIIRGLGYGLDESAINTIATKWRFRPGTRKGIPVDVQANIEVTFRLY